MTIGVTTTGEPAHSRWLVGPPRWIFGAALLATVAVTFYAASPPGGFFEPALLALGGWAALGITFVVRLVIALATHTERQAMLRRAALWLLFPVALVASFAVSAADVPVRVGLRLAKADMLAFARDAGAAEPARVGPYAVRRAERLPGGGAQFHLADAGFIDSSGWAYAPGGAPDSPVDEVTYTPLGDGWYTFVASF